MSNQDVCDRLCSLERRIRQHDSQLDDLAGVIIEMRDIILEVRKRNRNT